MKTYGQVQIYNFIEKIRRQRECGTIISLPESGVRRAVQAAFEKLDKVKELLVIDTNFFDFEIKKTKQINKLLGDQLTEDTKFIFVRNIKLSNKYCKQWLLFLDQFRNNNPQLNYIFLLQQEVDNIEIARQNVMYLPYVARKDKEYNELIAQNEARFETKLDSERVWNLSGGITGLVKQIAKFYSLNNIYPKCEDLREFWENYLEVTEPSILNYLGQNIKRPKKQVNSFLIKMCLVDQKGEIQSSLLKEALDKYKRVANFTVNLKQETIVVGEEEVGKRFKDSERNFIFRLFLKNTLSREEAGSIFFDSLEFSDYALDQRLSRLRKKMLSLGMDPKSIISDKTKHVFRWSGT